MYNKVIIVGSQWGDEGKGKIVDWLAYSADIVVRFQGGHNAGHTLVVDDKVYKLSLLPSGVVRGKLSLIGNGVVVDPTALFAEIERVKILGLNITSDILKISESACLILPIHQELDILRENAAGKNKIGTTGRGIGPAYEDKVGRRAIKMCDLADKELLIQKIEKLSSYHDALRIGFGTAPINQKELLDYLLSFKEKLAPFISPVWKILNEASQKGKKILFEGAQGIMLDVDFGTYPFVTSSNTLAPAAAIGSGMGNLEGVLTLGILKAYTTRVGSGPFPSELFDEKGAKMADIGKEFGTVTNRPRRCGWFDAVIARQSSKIAGITAFVLTKLDILDSFEEIKICTSYNIDGKIYDYLPASYSSQIKAEPIYETLPGWLQNTSKIRDYDALPENAKSYIKRIEELTEVKIAAISTSPQREDTILISPIF